MKYNIIGLLSTVTMSCHYLIYKHKNTPRMHACMHVNFVSYFVLCNFVVNFVSYLLCIVL